MKVIGIDPSPKNVATIYEENDGWTKVKACELPECMATLAEHRAVN